MTHWLLLGSHLKELSALNSYVWQRFLIIHVQGCPWHPTQNSAFWFPHAKCCILIPTANAAFWPQPQILHLTPSEFCTLTHHTKFCILNPTQILQFDPPPKKKMLHFYPPHYILHLTPPPLKFAFWPPPAPSTQNSIDWHTQIFTF